MKVKKWFILANEEVSGPFATDEIKELVEHSNGRLTFRIWWKGSKEWITLQQWQKALPQIENDHAGEALWYIEVYGRKRHEPLTFEQLLEHLKEMQDLGQVRVWKDEMPKWENVFAVDCLVRELGLSRRKNTRVPVTGVLTVETEDGVTRVGKAVTISENGIGFSGIEALTIGRVCKLTLDSPKLHRSIRATIEILYYTRDGKCGARFSHIDSESLAAVVSYVRNAKASARAAS